MAQAAIRTTMFAPQRRARSSRLARLCLASALAILAGCGSSGSGTPSKPPLSITTTSLPDGQVGSAYSVQLAASGGTSPYFWTITTGTLPAGLSLAGSGLITGTPSATSSAASLSFLVTDSSTPSQSQSTKATLTVNRSPNSVSVTPARAGIVVRGTLVLTVDTNDAAGVTWSATGPGCSGAACGVFSSASALNGVATTYTAPSQPGTYQIAATSKTDGSKSTSVTVGVTDLAGVTTYHNNLSRDGVNTSEFALQPASVTTTSFGKLFSCTVDGAIYGQPLWVPALTIGSSTHNVVFVATQHDSVYAFDADSNTGPCAPLWHANLLDAPHGATSGETSVPSSGTGTLVGSGFGDIAPEVGVLGTPVIDPATNTIYLISKSVVASGPTFYQRLHALDLLTGKEKLAGPATIAATFPGTGDGGSTVKFDPRQQSQRAGLALVNGVVYIAWASHEDNYPYYGWVIGYDASNLSQKYVFNASPNVHFGGIWMGGAAPSADSSNHLFLITGNAAFDANSAAPPNNDYGDSFLKLNNDLTVAQAFTPSDEQSDNLNDVDFGSGGTAVLLDLPANGALPTHLVVGGGKDGSVYVLNRDHLGGYGDAGAWQRFDLGSAIFSTSAFWKSTLYMAGVGGALNAFKLDPATAMLGVTPASSSAAHFGFPGSTPSISSSQNSNGIVWALDNGLYCTPQSAGCGPTVLHAFDATNVANELWNSSMGTGNAAGFAVKFTVPTVANGKVYVGTRGNNTGGSDDSSSVPGELDVYGLLPK